MVLPHEDIHQESGRRSNADHLQLIANREDQTGIVNLSRDPQINEMSLAEEFSTLAQQSGVEIDLLTSFNINIGNGTATCVTDDDSTNESWGSLACKKTVDTQYSSDLDSSELCSFTSDCDGDDVDVGFAPSGTIGGSETLAGRFERACNIGSLPQLASSVSLQQDDCDAPFVSADICRSSAASMDYNGTSVSYDNISSTTLCSCDTNNITTSSLLVTDTVSRTDVKAIPEPSCSKSKCESPSTSCTSVPVASSQQTGNSCTTDKLKCRCPDDKLSGRSFSEELVSVDSDRDTVNAGKDHDAYEIETTLPYMNWDYLEEQLEKALEKEHQSQSRQNDRDEIRRRLAMEMDDDRSERPFRKPSLQMRLQNTMQVCYVNEASNDGESQSMIASIKAGSPFPSSTRSSLTSLRLNVPSAGCKSGEEPDFFTKQARLQAEARLALAQVRPMAHMQLQLEKQCKKKAHASKLSDIVGVPCGGDGKLDKNILLQMNVGQLQVIVNDLHTEIEANNIQLMEFLMQRDDLHMAQDSMLVDIEDLTRRAQEYDARLKSKTRDQTGH